MIYKMYIANAHGKKLSGYTEVEADSFTQAKAIYRVLVQSKNIDPHTVELLAEV